MTELLRARATWTADLLAGDRCAAGCGKRKRVGSVNCWDHRGTDLDWVKLAGGAWVLLSKEERDGR